jgi:ribosomal protein S18 acetylase RimI-like enzyme
MIKEMTFADINQILHMDKEFSGPALYNHKQLEEMIKNPVYCNYSLFIQDNLIGYLISVITDNGIDLLKICIDSSQRKNGYGKQLLNELIVKHASHKTIYVEVETTNNSAITFYLDNGFTKLEEKKDYYGKEKTAFTMIRRAQ